MNIEPFTVIEIVCDWTDLQNAINQAELLAEDDYTFASWNKLDNALKMASKLNEESDPVAINNACLRLNAALEALEQIDDDSVTAVISSPLSVNPGAP